MNETEVRASRARIVAATHAARRRIERTLHDGPQQHLVAMAVKLRLAESAIDSDPEEAKRMLADLREDVQATVQHLRDLAHDIYPPLLADRGLDEALRGAAGRAAGTVDVDVGGGGNRRYGAETEAAVYFSCLEAMQAAKGPLSIWVREAPGRLEFEISGDMGDAAFLRHVADRTDTLAGEMSMETGSAGGTQILGWVPLDPAP